jgi:hypothetical protein
LAARANRIDDLARIDALQIGRGRAQVGVAELALDDVDRDAFAGELDRVRVAQLMGANLRLTPASTASWRNSERAAVADHRRPPVAPSITQKSGPGGSRTR